MTESIIAKRLSGIPPSLMLKHRHNATIPESVCDRKEVEDVLSESLATPTIGVLVQRKHKHGVTHESIRSQRP